MNEKPTSPRDIQSHVRGRARAYVDGILKRRGMKSTKFAAEMRAAGFDVTASTLYRIINEETTADTETLFQLRLYTGEAIDFLETPESKDAARSGFSEPDATRYSADDAPDDLKPGPDQGVWEINTRIVELAGYVPGDMVLFDFTRKAEPGDLVVAQNYNVNRDPERNNAETLIRVWDPPNLVVRTMDPAILESPAAKPQQVDEVRLHIVGSLVKMIRRPRWRIQSV